MGWLPALARIAARMPRVVNALTQAPVLSRIAKELGGVAPERRIPRFADETFQAWYRRRGPRGTGRRGDVVLWPDTFSNSFHPHVAEAAVEVLEAAGWRVIVPQEAVCCGLTWISTGQLDVAERVLQRTAAVLKPYLDAGTLVLGLEPSCTAVFRSDARELFPDDPTIARLREQTVTLSELLTQHTPGWKAPHLARRAVIQEHCHQHAIMGFDADLEVLRRTGVDAQVLDSGCCGLAGNFGFEKGHYEVSDACGERALFPALRETDDETIVLADGFSCRTQIEQGATAGREAVHLAELLAAALHGDPAPEGSRPELAYAERPRSSAVASGVALAGVAGVAVTAATVLLGALGRRRR
jgi:Fe-S oxidoreductase